MYSGYNPANLRFILERGIKWSDSGVPRVCLLAEVSMFRINDSSP